MRMFSNVHTAGILALVLGTVYAYSARAGTLSCSVAISCPTGTVIFRMSDTSNAHAELPTLSNYPWLACCTGVTGLGNSCSGTSAVAINLSGPINAHVEMKTQTNYDSIVCLSVPSGGAVSVGYQANNCTGYDTTLGSMTGATNAHVGDSTAYTTKICATASMTVGVLSVDIVDADGEPAPSPSMPMSATAFSFVYQTSDGIFGIPSQKIRANNTTSNPRWTLAVAATDGPSALWSTGTFKYDFNDPTPSVQDGPDADAYGGQTTVDPSAGTITPKSGCAATGLSLGSFASLDEGVTDSVTLMNAGADAQTNCFWDLTGVAIAQTIPTEQPTGGYSINMTITITAN